MRWKLMRRRLSVSAPRMIVRSHLPWPLRWAAAALMLGFSAALAMWAFEFGKDIAGVGRDAVRDRQAAASRAAAAPSANAPVDRQHRRQPAQGRKAAQERLTQQLKQIEAENLRSRRPRLLRAAAAAGAAPA
jgi:hypothetical protein